MDKVNFVIFVIKPLLLDFQVNKTTRIRLPALFKPSRSSLIIYSTPYQSLVLSRARRYSGTPTHRLAEDRKSSGQYRGLKILVSVVRFRPRAPFFNTISMTYISSANAMRVRFKNTSNTQFFACFWRETLRSNTVSAT